MRFSESIDFSIMWATSHSVSSLIKEALYQGIQLIFMSFVSEFLWKGGENVKPKTFF